MYIIADEFNLLPQNLMIFLIPFLESGLGDSFNHPEDHERITLSAIFLFILTRN
jgi:hypothetical protein